MVLLEPRLFLDRLSLLLEQSKDKGSLYLTMKRYSHTQTKQAKKSSEAMDLLHSTDTQFCSIVRATLGNHKISTLVEPSNLISFTDAYTAITRLHMDSLKRKDRKDKKNRSKAKKSGSSEPANESTTNV